MSRTRALPHAPAETRGPAPGVADPVAVRIRARRLALGWSLKRLSDATGGLAASFLFNIECGRKVPSEEVAGRIAAALGDDAHLATYRAWARAKSRGRSGRLDHDALAEAWDLLRQGFSGVVPREAPTGAAPPPVATRLSVPVLVAAIDPGDAVRPPVECVMNTLRLDPTIYGERTAEARAALTALRRPFAIPLDVEQALRAPGLVSGFLAIVTRSAGAPPADTIRRDVAYVVRAGARLELASGAVLLGERPVPTGIASSGLTTPDAIRERVIGHVALQWPAL